MLNVAPAGCSRSVQNDKIYLAKTFQTSSNVNHKKSSILMTVKLQTENDFIPASTSIKINQETENEKVLCSHCQRTATNGIKCKGICVADNDY